MSHFEKRYLGCGHLHSQCRCPSVIKQVEHIDGYCPKCLNPEPRPEGFVDLIGECITTGVTYKPKP